jgi:hypothetical protein
MLATGAANSVASTVHLELLRSLDTVGSRAGHRCYNGPGVEMQAVVKSRLLASMDAGRLIIVCGAGLSMAAPSSLPSAKAVSQKCFDDYRVRIDPNVNPGLRDNLENFAEYFVGRGELKSVFIPGLVPWNDFVRPYNPGHSAIADFLLTRAAVAGLSTNYDILIERRAWDYGADFRGSLDGDEANSDGVNHSPLLKFHGCSQRDKLATVWAPSQLEDAVTKPRIDSSKVWMAANLRQRDLLIVGFWSDWKYLNHLIGTALQGIDPISVTVVDLTPENELEQKAPELWAIAHSGNVVFNHIQESGADVLNELRVAFSQGYMRQILASGENAFTAATTQACPAALKQVNEANSETLYDWRRDAEGVPTTQPARARLPQQCDIVGMVHLLIRHAGGVATGPFYSFNGRTVRVVNGANAMLSQIRDRFVAAPAAQHAEIVIAVGAYDAGLPGNVVRDGRKDDLIRPTAGGDWFDTQGGRQELGI